jgi:acyl-CoA thioester hydrolase
MTNSNFYIHPITVSAADIDTMGHVNNVVYLRYIQEAATAHWLAKASEVVKSSVLWVVLRHEIDYLAPAFENEVLQAKTWVGETGGVKSVRFVEITNALGKPIIKARTIWCMLDAITLKPKRIELEMMEPFIDNQKTL